jgi:hypothetical protein
MKKVVKKIKEETKVVISRPKLKVYNPHEELINSILKEIAQDVKDKPSVEIIGLLNDCLRHIRNN